MYFLVNLMSCVILGHFYYLNEISHATLHLFPIYTSNPRQPIYFSLDFPFLDISYK
jgi:hypothetical protein